MALVALALSFLLTFFPLICSYFCITFTNPILISTYSKKWHCYSILLFCLFLLNGIHLFQLLLSHILILPLPLWPLPVDCGFIYLINFSFFFYQTAPVQWPTWPTRRGLGLGRGWDVWSGWYLWWWFQLWLSSASFSCWLYSSTGGGYNNTTTYCFWVGGCLKVDWMVANLMLLLPGMVH